MSKKLPIKDQIFWKNFFYAAFAFAAAVLIFSLNVSGDSSLTNLNLSQGYGIASFLAVLYLCYRSGMHFMRFEKMEEFKQQKNLTNKEFRDRYGEILDYID